MRAWVKLRDGCAIEGRLSITAEVKSWGDSDTVLELTRMSGGAGGTIEAELLLVPLSSIAWLKPV